MSPEEQILADVRNVIDGLPKNQQLEVYRSAQKLREFLGATGPIGALAMALIGAEMAA